MDPEEPPARRRRFLFLLLAALIALLMAGLGSYLVVVSENSASAVNGPATLYGPSPNP